MMSLLLGLVVFLGVHSLRLLAPRSRQRWMTQLGPARYKLIYSLVSLAGFALLLQGYAAARQVDVVLWTTPFWMKHLALALMWPAMVLLLASFVPGNGIRARLRHPLTLSVKTWALAHLLANGQLAQVLLFASMLVWAVLIYRAAKAEDHSRMVGLMGSGAQMINLGTLITVLLGSALWAWMALGGGHLMLIGVSPMQ